ncbi:glycosyltransferase family 2 protein [Salipiger abyssi]|uniref:glycosyltransferase family 2 protein n=1 Tax=Salipiger abyssi TaxID=1250539 RepID=UPI001A8D7BFC|nr:glycosyltransferase family 2 protein [Salipiger abyssi]MBN9890477.1 glycosyltransferase family 2 protein [Salipiger abyssi]
MAGITPAVRIGGLVHFLAPDRGAYDGWICMTGAPTLSPKTGTIATATGPVTMDTPRYGAVIRAYECTPLLKQVITALRAQTAPPEAILIVDSSHSAQTARDFAALGATVVPYPKGEFNYSRAINVGVAANPAPLTLIVSSHVLLAPEVIEHGWRMAQSHNLEVVFWTPPGPQQVGEVEFVVGRRNFTGRNGMSNSAALVPTERLRVRPFREEVFSAEDQEWTRYYLGQYRRGLYRIQTAAMQYLNPNHGEKVWSHDKLINEELAIGHFVNRRLIMPDRIIARFLRGVLATLRRRPERARMHFGIAKAFLMANFKQPVARSRYF